MDKQKKDQTFSSEPQARDEQSKDEQAKTGGLDRRAFLGAAS